MFSTSQRNQPVGSNLFKSTLPSLNLTTPQSQSSLFGSSKPQSQSIFGSGSATQPQGTSLFGQSTQQQTQQAGNSLFGELGQNAQQIQPQHSVLQLGQTQQSGSVGAPQNPQPLWEEGRGLGVYRTIPAQITTIAEKWNPANLSSPLRTYLYSVVAEDNSALYQPNLYDPRLPLEDEGKWEEAVSKRPGPNYVPSLVRGFWELGKRAQRQREFIEKCNIRLHEINASLDAQLEIHSQRIATRMAECRRRHVVASQRTLALAAKIQILRNRGYVMDNAEEELGNKLRQLERDMFDPSLNGREQEIWARMIGIRERGKRLKAEMEKVVRPPEVQDASLDEETAKSAKKVLDAYDVQLKHLQTELQLVQQEFEDWERAANS